MFLCLRVTSLLVLFFCPLLLVISQDFSYEEKEHTTVNRESKCKALNINHH